MEIKIAEETFTASDDALEQVRMNFNPSGLDKVARIKLLAAALITEINDADPQIQARAGDDLAAAEMHVINAGMWGVRAHTSQV
ncbi:MAG: hypothetical protein AAGE80_05440 [Pseudomonadota bacterium]